VFKPKIKRGEELMLFDTHCHLDTEKFDGDRDVVFKRAHEKGVTRFLNPAYDLESSRRAVALANARNDLVAAIGIHPNDANDFSDETIAALRKLFDANKNKIAAIGEIGLDYYWKTVAPEKQKHAFVTQLDLARESNLTVIIHCREAYDDTLDILEKHWRDRPLVMHSFGGDASQAKRALDFGFHLGIGGPVTYPNAQNIRDVVRFAPINRLVIETDAPYLSPQRHRGKRNEPAYVTFVAEKIADLRDTTIDEVALHTTQNAMQLFMNR
jgi:TatD DNase family protein